MKGNGNLKNQQLRLYKPPPKDDQSKNYKKLIAVIVISVIFISVEAAGGIISGSISVISDSVHLLTDLIGFILAFVFIWYSSKKPTSTMTFGYHRTQLLGALGNLFIIWALALFLLVEAFDRIINKIFVQEPFVMLLISGIGLPINIIMYFVLHDGGHSHGLMAQECGHEHPDAIVCHEELCQDVQCLINQEYVDHCHKKKGEKEEIHSHNTKVTIDERKNIIRPKFEQSKNKMLEQDLSEEVNMKKGLNSHHHDHGVDHETHNIEHRAHCHDHDHDHDHDHGHGHDHGHDHGHGHSHQNMSMKAAVVHALSDIIFSIGLVIASLVIFFLGSDNGKTVTQWNNWHYFDPCVTVIFTGLVFLSTWPITQNCYYIIMESTPPNFSVQELEKDFMKVKGVRDVHDLHIWDLRPGKTILTAHVFSEKDQERYVLKELTDICRHKKIYHSTLQVEEQAWKDHEEYILCDHDIH